jgi:hypothetical protein
MASEVLKIESKEHQPKFQPKLVIMIGGMIGVN